MLTSEERNNLLKNHHWTNEMIDKQLVNDHINIRRLSDYHNSLEIIQWECLVCGYKWQASYNRIRNGCVCQKCSGNTTRIKHKQIEDTDMKICPECKRLLKQTDFYKNNNKTDKLSSYCKKCLHTKDIERRYGIDKEKLDIMLKEQDNKCPGCGKTFDLKSKKKSDIPHIDHDHETGKIRGILCHRCNLALGFVEDNKLLENLIKYLKKYQ
jgi:hypothetical protein